jgi:hypothetical protein
MRDMSRKKRDMKNLAPHIPEPRIPNKSDT